MKKEESELIRTVSLLVIFGAFCLLGTVKLASKQLLDHKFNQQSRIEQIDTNVSLCKQPTINEFPNDFIPFETFKYPGKPFRLNLVIKISILIHFFIGLLIHLLIIIYLLIGISIVCDKFFVESLSLISKSYFLNSISLFRLSYPSFPF